MLSSAEIKRVRALSQKKFRKETGLFIAEGDKIVGELLKQDWAIEKLYATQEWVDREKPAGLADRIHVLTPEQLSRISQQTTPNKALAIVQIPLAQPQYFQLSDGLGLVLDNIQDPGNLGTIIRTADWFGIRHILCSPDTADAYNPKVIQASMGSFATVKLHYTPLVPFLMETKKNATILAATLQGEDARAIRLVSTPTLLVVGNESRGVSTEVLSHITRQIKIPQYATADGPSGAESLNVAIATSILLYALRG